MAIPVIIAMWSAPRSRSTAFARMMAERGDFDVLHEPFSHVVDFGRATVDGVEVTGEQELIAAIRRKAAVHPVFFKDTTDFRYPGLLADHDFLRETVHTFIIREPAEAIASHFALNAELSCADVGFERLDEIHRAAVAQTGREPVVINSADLVERPEQTVRSYCAAVGIPFLPEALSWQAEMRPEWQQTHRWHELTGRTNGFGTAKSEYEHTVENNEKLAAFYDHHLPFYERLDGLKLGLRS